MFIAGDSALRHSAGTGPVVCIDTVRQLMVLGSLGFERDSQEVVTCNVGFTIEYFVLNKVGDATFCLVVTPLPARQPT